MRIMDCDRKRSIMLVLASTVRRVRRNYCGRESCDLWLIRSFVVTAQAALQVVDTVANWG